MQDMQILLSIAVSGYSICTHMMYDDTLDGIPYHIGHAVQLRNHNPSCYCWSNLWLLS